MANAVSDSDMSLVYIEVAMVVIERIELAVGCRSEKTNYRPRDINKKKPRILLLVFTFILCF
jgi:hypothetical protein